MIQATSARVLLVVAKDAKYQHLNGVQQENENPFDAYSSSSKNCKTHFVSSIELKDLDFSEAIRLEFL